MGGKWNRWVNPIYEIEDGKKIPSKVYKTWISMVTRCANSQNYKDVFVSEDFLNYDYFYDWYFKQKGHGCNDSMGRPFELDKDLLGTGLSYCAEHCVFIPKELNCLFRKHKRIKNNLPIGVSKDEYKNKYRARISLLGVQKSLGYYDTIDEARKVYLEKRSERVGAILEEYKEDLDSRVKTKLEELYLL